MASRTIQLSQWPWRLRQALQSLPDLTEASKHIMVRETGEGLNI